MLMPKRVKYRRVHRGRMKGAAHRGNFIAYGDWGLQATEPCWVTSQQIEAARVALTRYTKRARMGSGKGAPEYWVAVVKPGRVMFEIGGIDGDVAKEALRLAAGKLPLKTKIINKETQEAGGESK